MLRPSEFQRLQEAIQTLYVHANADEFPARLLSALAPLIPNSIACYTELWPEDGRVLNVAAEPNERLDQLLPVLAEFQLQNPAIRAFVESGNPRVMLTSDYISRRDWHRTDVYQHFYRPLDVEEQLAFMLQVTPATHLGVVFNREHRSFTEEERHLLSLLRPHVAIAFTNAQRVSAIQKAFALRQPTHHGLLRLSAEGEVTFATEHARYLLSCYWQAGTSLVPDEVRDWLRTQIAPGAKRTQSPRRVMHQSGSHGLLQLRLIEEADEAGWLLLLDERPLTADEQQQQLPPRLRRVLSQLLAGNSEKAVARQMQLSHHTVHEYVKQIYRRLDVNSRAELLARFLRGG